jgi:DNA-binding NtrC family response regulator
VKPAGSTKYVVDDEPAIGTSLVAILALKGFHAKCFTSPLEALKAVRSEPRDILVSDVMMLGVCGIDLAILMTERFPKCRVLLFSGQATTSDLLKTAHNKGYDFRLLSKSVLPEGILYEIGKQKVA